MTDTQVLDQMTHYSRHERKLHAAWLKNLSLVEDRRLYALAGYESLWTYVVKGLNYSKASAGKRIQVSRTAKKYPVIYDLLEKSLISMSVISKLSPALTDANHEKILKKCAGMTVEEAEEVIASLLPKPDVKESIRATVTHQTELSVSPTYEKPKRKEKLKPLSEARYHVNFSIDPTNIRLTCRAHNLWFATRAYGRDFIERRRER